MVMRSSTIDEISRYINLDKETLITKGIQSLLKEKRRAVMLERLELLHRYRIVSKEELEDKIEKGDVEEHPVWEDLIFLENLEAESESIDGYLKNL